MFDNAFYIILLTRLGTLTVQSGYRKNAVPFDFEAISIYTKLIFAFFNNRE